MKNLGLPQNLYSAMIQKSDNINVMKNNPISFFVKGQKYVIATALCCECIIIVFENQWVFKWFVKLQMLEEISCNIFFFCSFQ